MGAKRKERDEAGAVPAEDATHGSTVFVSSLPYNATSTDIQTLFSDFAPIRTAFVVLDKDSKTSKGVGYVTFAIKEDAQRVVEQLSASGISLQGRNLRVQWAGRKPVISADDAPKEPKRPRRDPRSLTAPAADPTAIRTIVISGLPDDIESKVIWKKARKCGGAEKVEWPVEDSEGKPEPGVARVLFNTHVQALAAVNALHAHTFKGRLLSVVLKKRLDAATDVSKKPSRAGRLIVRNVPWHVTEEDLRSLFLPFGPIHSIELPVGPSETSSTGKSRGFAFVWMLAKSDAEKAISGVNGQEVGKRHGKPGRVVAVDWALSKDKWHEAESLAEKDMDAISESADPIHLGMDGESVSESDAEAQDKSNLGSSQEFDEDEKNSLSSRSASPIGRPSLPSTDVGTTVFIRNIPFEATEEELRIVFRAFGPLRYARITVDADSGRSRGTGFACFWNREHADRAIADAELLNAESGLSNGFAKSNPFSMPSILTPDPSSSLAAGLILHGRTLAVSRAVPRDEADRLKDEGAKRREKEDKRNLYLMREGVIFPNTPAAATISAPELDRRVASFNARRTLLRSNPSLYISKTRLSVRQLPTFVTDRTLKRLAIHAIREFEKEVAQGSRACLSKDELTQLPDADEKTGSKRRRGERNSAVIQAKIVRQAERVDPLTGKGRSKGYGFLELRTHLDALRVLRWSNNNPSVAPLMEGWWKSELEQLTVQIGKDVQDKPDEKEALGDRLKRIKSRLRALEDEKDAKPGKALILEFSIENVQVVRRRKELLDVSKERVRKRTAEADDSASAISPGPAKRPRVSKPAEPAEMATVAKHQRSGLGRKASGEGIASVIGRKRKERRAKKGGR